MKEDKNLVKIERLFLALSDKTRLRILNLLHKGEISVHHFTEILEESQPKISRHLAYLRNAGIVSTRREGKWIYYRIKISENKYESYILQDTLEWLGIQENMRRDYEKFRKICESENLQIESLESSVRNIYDEADVIDADKKELEIFLL